MGERHVAVFQFAEPLTEAGEVTVNGQMSGNITASDRVYITANAKVLSDISAPRVVIEDVARGHEADQIGLAAEAEEVRIDAQVTKIGVDDEVLEADTAARGEADVGSSRNALQPGKGRDLLLDADLHAVGTLAVVALVPGFVRRK